MPFGLTKARLGIFFCFIFCDKAKKIATVFFVILAIHFECKFKQKGLKFKHNYCIVNLVVKIAMRGTPLFFLTGYGHQTGIWYFGL